MSWIPNHVQAFCTKNNLINPTPCGSQWAALNFDTKKWVDVPSDDEDKLDDCTDLESTLEFLLNTIALCPQCSSPMERQASEAPNNAGSDAEWYQCPTCDYETEVS